MPSSNDDYSFKPHEFRPRYTADETSDAAYEKDLQNRRFQQRKRRAIQLLLLIIGLLAAGVGVRVYVFFAGTNGGILKNMHHRKESQTKQQITKEESSGRRGFFPEVWTRLKKKDKKSKEAFNMAKRDSLGYFNEISSDEWLRLKQETIDARSAQEAIMAESSGLLAEGGANIDTNTWWINNWKINFTCKNKMRIGGKWICDPRRIVSLADEYQHWISAGNKNLGNVGNQCIVYASGGNEYEFANQFLDYTMARMIEIHHEQEVLGHATKKKKRTEQQSFISCEVHVFSPTGEEPPQQREGLIMHPWGFRPSNRESMGSGTDNAAAPAFKTIHETISELGHVDKTISILALDCEGCEWDIYEDILALDALSFQQIIMQMHGTPFVANDVFSLMQQAGYIVFHKEMEPTGNGEVYDYSFMKMAGSYFDSDK